MKFTKSITVLMLAGVVMFSCKSNDSETEVATTEATTETEANAEELLVTTSFMIEGMHCEMGCAGAIKKKLAKLEGVKSVEIDFEGKKATISHDANKQTAENLVLTVEKMSKDYIITDVETSSDAQASLYINDKDKGKDKKKKKDTKEDKKEESKTETKEGCSTEAKKSCGTEKAGGCCASKKAGTL